MSEPIEVQELDRETMARILETMQQHLREAQNRSPRPPERPTTGPQVVRELDGETAERILEDMTKRLQEQSEPLLPLGVSTSHYTELPEDTRGDQTARNYNVYRREVGRLLAEGHENCWVLIKDEQIVGI